MFFFLCAKKSPRYMAVFLQAKLLHALTPAFEAFRFAQNGNFDPEMTRWEYDFKYRLAEQIPFAAEGNIWVYRHVYFGEGATLRCDFPPELFETLVATFLRPPPNQPCRRQEQSVRVPEDARRRLQEEFPWLTDEDFNVHFDRARRQHGHAAAAADPQPSQPCVMDAEQAEAVAVSVREQVLARREEWSHDFEESFFYVRQLGGNWTNQMLGQATDAATAFARKSVWPWCRLFSWPKQKGYSYSAYEVEGANFLAREMAFRGNFFYCIWRSHGSDPTFRYTDEQLRSYVPGIDWLNWTCEQDIEYAVFDRITEIGAAFPVNPQ